MSTAFDREALLDAFDAIGRAAVSIHDEKAGDESFLGNYATGGLSRNGHDMDDE